MLRFVDSAGKIVADNIEPARYTEYIGEAGEHDSYLKSPFLSAARLSRRRAPRRSTRPAQYRLPRMGVPLADREQGSFTN